MTFAITLHGKKVTVALILMAILATRLAAGTGEMVEFVMEGAGAGRFCAQRMG